MLKRSRMLRFVSTFAIGKLVIELLSRSRMFKLRAASNPSTEATLLPPALRLIKSNMSACVSGPVGFDNVSRIAAFRPGSGMLTSCARAVATALSRTNVRMAFLMAFELSTNV